MTTEEFKHKSIRLRPMLKEVALRYLHDADAAEDVAQDVLMRLWQMHERLRTPVDALARVLTRNLCIDRLRRQPHIVSINESTPPSYDDSASDNAAVERMMGIIDTLPDVQQTILRLRHMEGMPMAELARLLGMTEVALRKALSRARMAVRDRYLQQKES